MKVLSDRVLVTIKEQPKETVSKGGLYIPEIAKDKDKDKLIEATVVAVGAGYLMDSGVRSPLGVAVGDVVLINQYAGINVTEQTLVIKEAEIVLVK